MRGLLLGLAGLLASIPAGATTVVPPKFAELVNESDYVVRAVVKSVKSEWRQQGAQRHIFTQVELDVLEVITGTPPQPLVLQMLGGRVGDEALVVEGAPQFAVGDENVLFIRGNGRQFSPLTALMHGRYPVKHDQRGGAYMARSNQVPLHDTSEVSLPMGDGPAAALSQRVADTATALTPAQFTQQIRAAVDAHYTPAARAR